MSDVNYFNFASTGKTHAEGCSTSPSEQQRKHACDRLTAGTLLAIVDRYSLLCFTKCEMIRVQQNFWRSKKFGDQFFYIARRCVATFPTFIYVIE